MNIDNKVVVVAGPTASGKSSLALEIAKKCNGVIVNADSMQVYKGLPILSACPTKEDKKEIDHSLYNFLEPSQDCSAGIWAEHAKKEIKKIWNNNSLPIITGGSGLYINALIKGLSPIPQIDKTIQKQTDLFVEQNGIALLYKKLLQEDEKSALLLKENDRQRVVRAWNVLKSTGKSISYWRETPPIKPIDINPFVITIIPSKEELYPICNKRFDKMIESGAIKEAESFINDYKLENTPSTKAIGLKEIKSFLLNEIDINEVKRVSSMQTRRYAKRQITWFKKQLEADYILQECFKTDAFHKIYQELQSFLLT